MKAPERIHRLLKLVTILQTGQQCLSEDLVAAINASRRTVFRDLALLKDVGIPVLYDPALKTYAIEQSFFLPPVNLTLQEALGLMVLVHRYAANANLPYSSEITDAMAKIESCLPKEMQRHCKDELEFISYQPTPGTDITQVIGTYHQIEQAARRFSKLRVKYDSSYEMEEISFTFRPYKVKFISRAWYAIGYSEMHNEVRTFKLDRFTSIHSTEETFPDPKFDLAKYFGNAWVMIRGDREYDVRIRFSPKVAGNVEEVLWHSTQQMQYLDDGSLIFDVRVDGIEEIHWWIMGYGKEAVVESPVELRELIAQHVLDMSKTYELECSRSAVSMPPEEAPGSSPTI